MGPVILVRPRSFPRWPALLGVAILFGSALGGLLLAPSARGAAPSTTPVSGTIDGPSALGATLKSNYTVTAHGGYAEAANGTFVGIYGYNATLSGPNTTDALVAPSSGVLTNGSVVLSVTAPSTLQTLTLYVLVTSSYQGQNISTNLTKTISIVEPFRVNATLLVSASTSVGPFNLTIDLDGAPVGSVAVPVLTAGSSYPISFAYVDVDLSPGWHTFSISVSQLHGLVTFQGGLEQYSQAFYVTGPPPDETTWYLAGGLAFVGAIFIWMTRVGARRRGRAKK